ncbi:MAG: transcription elongation factor GreA [candidate division Zixibacteria bacterium]|nr:transcription elongation factor GreA [candidate division Zixibacteria bacterium]
MDSDPIYLSKQGRIKLENELRKLKTVDRPHLINEVKRARQMGDLAENAEYHAAKETQFYLERKIAELEDKLSRVRSVDTENIPSDKAYLFAKVLVKDQQSGEEIEYQLAPPDEAEAGNEIISIKSPIGAALLGKSIGDEFNIKVPAGIIRYKVLKISRE